MIEKRCEFCDEKIIDGIEYESILHTKCLRDLKDVFEIADEAGDLKNQIESLNTDIETLENQIEELNNENDALQEEIIELKKLDSIVLIQKLEKENSDLLSENRLLKEKIQKIVNDKKNFLR